VHLRIDAPYSLLPPVSAHDLHAAPWCFVRRAKSRWSSNTNHAPAHDGSSGPWPRAKLASDRG
jgi:hypothetical protein